LLRLLVFTLVGATVLLTGAQQLGSDGPWWLELSRYLPFPLLLLPAAAALLLSWRLSRFWRLASAAAIVLVATLAMGFEWHDGGDPAGSVRVMTYNVKAGGAASRPGGLAALAEEVARQRPDILVMQDAHPLLRGRAPDAKTPLLGLSELYAEGEYIVASRFPLRGCAAGQVETGGEPLGYVHCTVDTGAMTFQLVTVHFESPRSGLNAARREGFEGFETWQRNLQARLAQARALARALAPGARPLVLAGDLNAPQSSAVLQSLLGVGLRDAFASAGRGYGYTYGHTLRPGFSFLRIDHILVSPEIEVRQCFTGGAEASDHRPVIADLALRGAAAPAATARP
jgi:vancomycin resistance protein VanJ